MTSSSLSSSDGCYDEEPEQLQSLGSKSKRFISIDFAKGLSIFIMIMIHHIGQGNFEMPEEVDLLIHAVQPLNTLFLFYSGFGNAISLMGQIERYNLTLKDEENATYKKVYSTILLRCALMVAITYVLDILTKTAENLMTASIRQTPYTSTEWFALIFRELIDTHSVIVGIGLSTCYNALLFVAIMTSKRFTTLKNRIQAMCGVIVGIFCLSFILGFTQEYATYPVGKNCEFADKAEMDVMWFDGCMEIPSNDEGLLNWNELCKDSETCLAYVQDSNVPTKLSRRAVHYRSEKSRGYRVCTTNSSRDSFKCDGELDNFGKDDGTTIWGKQGLCHADDTAVLEMCYNIPWYAPSTTMGGGPRTWSVKDRTNAGQKFYQWFHATWAGYYGYFAYGMSSMVGFITAVYVKEYGHNDKRLFSYLYMLSIFLLLLGVPVEVWLFMDSPESNDCVVMNSVFSQCLYLGAGLLIYTSISSCVDGRPTKGCGSCCKCCGASNFSETSFFRFFRRFGAMSFTVYATHYFMMRCFGAMFNAMSGYKATMCIEGLGYPTISECSLDDLTAGWFYILYFIVSVGFWWPVLWLWEKFNYIYSIEWLIQHCLNIVRKNKSFQLSDRATRVKKEFNVEVDESEMGICSPCGACFKGGYWTRFLKDMSPKNFEN